MLLNKTANNFMLFDYFTPCQSMYPAVCPRIGMHKYALITFMLMHLIKKFSCTFHVQGTTCTINFVRQAKTLIPWIQWNLYEINEFG